MALRSDIRNVAIVAHVDHGKTTLIDAMFRQTQALSGQAAQTERIMDSNPLERERGITIFSKHASVVFKGVTVNIIDTPGHADFGGEVERILQMVDGVLLLVDAAEGPLPQTKFVLRKALERGLRAVVIINKIDRPDAEPNKVLDHIFDLFVSLHATDHQLDFPVLYACSRDGYARRRLEDTNLDLIPLFETILDYLPAPDITIEGGAQLLVTNTDYSDYLGRLAVGRITRGTLAKNQAVVALRADRPAQPFRVSMLYKHQGVERIPADLLQAGDIGIVAGFGEILIGDTIAAQEQPEALPGLTIDAPTLTMHFQVNDSPFAGREGQYVTTRHLRERLYREAETNLSLRVADTASPDTLQVSGRGELHLSVLIETMRREGFEFQVSQPKVILKEESGVTLEPFEELIIEVPSESVGSCIEGLGARRAEMQDMQTLDDGRTRVHFFLPSRCLFGFRSEFLSLTRGEGFMHHMVEGYHPFRGGATGRRKGVLIASDPGESSAYGLFQLRDRGEFFIAPGIEVYTGMIVGEHTRESDLNINVCKTKNLTNMRSKSADEALVLPPPRSMSLEQLLEYINDDELLEITPKNLRLRKKILDATARKRADRAAGL